MNNLHRRRTNWRWVTGFSLAIIFMILAVHVHGQELLSTDDPAIEPVAIQDNTTIDFVAPSVFQAAGPNIASIQGTITDFRAALGDPVNGNALEEKVTGRREINWDGGVPPSDVTTPPVNPFNTFLNTRGAQFTTPGIGLSQAPPSGGPQGGLVGLFGNASYATTFRAFSPCGCSRPWGAISLTPLSSWLVQTETCKQPLLVLVRSSLTSINLMAVGQEQSRAIVTRAR
jgi:hypothetical protein